MLAKSARTGGFLPDDGALDQPERVFAEHDDEVRRPLSRDIPPEIKERPAPQQSEPDRQAGTYRDDKPPRSTFRRVLHVSLGALLLASAAGGGYLYWDNAPRFETTEDAFIAARQFAIAPKVS